jgi:HemY protein
MRAFPAILVIAILVAGSVFFADRPGSVAMVWEDWRIETSVAMLVLGVAIVSLVVAALVWILRRFVGGPRAFMRRRRERRRRAGYRALTQGMVAVAAGDAEEAQRQARRADVLLAEPPLTLLLSAQAAQLNGDENAAKKYFTAMLGRPETEFLGLRGLITQAMRTGEHGTARRLAERAREIRPKTPWVLASLFELEAREGDWKAALQTLGEATKRKALPPGPARRHQAAILYQRSIEAESDDRPRDALAQAQRAHTLEPGFAPAAERAARLLLREEKPRQAAKVLETAWHAAPHPTLVGLYAALYPGETPLARLKRIERLASLNPSHVESHLALAAASLEAQLWGAVRRHLEASGIRASANGANGAEPAAAAGSAGARACRLMAELEERGHGNVAAAQAWLARSATAAPDPVYVCAACAAESAEWRAHCPGCGAFDTLDWRVPAHARPALVAPAPAARRLPVPAAVAGSKPGTSEEGAAAERPAA